MDPCNDFRVVSWVSLPMCGSSVRAAGVIKLEFTHESVLIFVCSTDSNQLQFFVPTPYCWYLEAIKRSLFSESEISYATNV